MNASTKAPLATNPSLWRTRPLTRDCCEILAAGGLIVAKVFGVGELSPDEVAQQMIDAMIEADGSAPTDPRPARPAKKKKAGATKPKPKKSSGKKSKSVTATDDAAALCEEAGITIEDVAGFYHDVTHVEATHVQNYLQEAASDED